MARSPYLGGKIRSTPGIFITDRIKQGELEVKYCPTEDMIADYFTKPIQGKMFTKFHKAIMKLKD